MRYQLRDGVMADEEGERGMERLGNCSMLARDVRGLYSAVRQVMTEFRQQSMIKHESGEAVEVACQGIMMTAHAILIRKEMT